MSRKTRFSFAWLSGVLLLGFACQETTPPFVGQESRLSDCGGFAAKGDALYADPEAYCDAELVHWRYDPIARRLSLADTRVLLNCCGSRSIQAGAENGVYLISERDRPEGQRCHCQCVFDFALDLEGVPEGEIRFKLTRDVEDDTSPVALVIEETIDLTIGEGSFVVNDTDVGPFCATL